jgi:acetyltransferase
MTIRNLERLFQPRSVAVIGASPRLGSLGYLVLRNLIAGGFPGPLYPVNPRHTQIEGLTAYPSVSVLPERPDLAVICTPPASVPGLIKDLGDKGTRAAIVLTAGLSGQVGGAGKTLQAEMLDQARPFLLRILGPNCLGLLVPGAHLNASFAHVPAAPGGVAFVSQSGALCTAMLDWADTRGVGFSHVISLGNSADVDLGDTLEYLARDLSTGAIVLYVEGVTRARKFMSALRAAARAKPVIVIKGGRANIGAKAAHSHTGAMAGSDAVFDAAIRRAGALRVHDIDELFDAVETLTHMRSIQGERLAILTNGGGPGVLAADAVAVAGGRMADLSDDTVAHLDRVLPGTWSHGNPIDIIGDAPADRFGAAARVLALSPDLDAVLFSYAPTAASDSPSVARAMIEAFKGSQKPLFANWLGGRRMEEARHLFENAHIPTFDTPERAARAFLNLVDYKRNQQSLMETPPDSAEPGADRLACRSTIDDALAAGRTMLSEAEAKSILQNYGIPVVATAIVVDAEDALVKAREIGFPVALKLLSRDVTHKSDVGGVVLDIATEDDLRKAAETIRQRLTDSLPNARFDGYTVQKMIRRPRAVELIVGGSTDPVFGPFILIGQGGTATEIVKDIAIGLPPLNKPLARDMLAQTRISKLLGGYRDVPPADLASVSSILVQISRLMCDHPQILEIDINPLLVDANGAIALDARIRVDRTSSDAKTRLAILPYPDELCETIDWNGQTLTLRPIRPEDEPAHQRLLAETDPNDIRLRFFGFPGPFRHEDLARLTQIDYDREMAFVATVTEPDGIARTLGVVRAITDPDSISAEFAILVESRHKAHGIGTLLMKKMIDYTRNRGTQRLTGEILRENDAMLDLAQALGFKLSSKRPAVSEAVLDLTDRQLTSTDGTQTAKAASRIHGISP